MNWFKKLLFKNQPSPPILKHSVQNKCGCYPKNSNQIDQIAYGLMPLKHIDYQIEVANGLCNVTLEQCYLNPSDKFLQVVFSFLIDPNSCVYKFVAQFSNKRIEGIVRQKQQAKIDYKQAVQKGKIAVIAERDTSSSSIMDMQIGNIGPKQEVKITISYLSELTIQQNVFYQLHLPGTISPRYMNDAETLKNSNQMQKTAKGLYTWNFKVTINSTRRIVFHKSVTHDLTLLNQNQTGTEVVLVMSKQSVPNKDFTLLYTTQGFHLPSCVFGKTDISSTVMISFIPKFCKLSVNDAYKASIQNSRLQTDMDSVRCQYVFLLDRSGSMSGRRIQKAIQVLSLFLKSLPEDSYFNVISFGNTYESLFLESTKYEKKNLVSAIYGRNRNLQTLKQLLKSKLKDGYPRQIFLLTDGGVQNTKSVLELVEKNIKFCRVHSIGIGNGASQDLIKGCAVKGKGKFIFISDDQNPSEKIICLLEESLTPVISKIDIKFDESIVESIFPNPTSIPYILKNQVVNFYITFKGIIIQKDFSFKFCYEDSKNRQMFQSNIIVDPKSPSFEFVDKMSHYKIIRTLQNAFKTKQVIEDKIYYSKVINKKQETIKKSIRHQILSEFTAFVCIQKQLVDGKYQQIMDKGRQKVKIQNISPFQYESGIKKQAFQNQIRNKITNQNQIAACSVYSFLQQNERKLNLRGDFLKAKAKQLLQKDDKKKATKYVQEATRIQKQAQMYNYQKIELMNKKIALQQSFMDNQLIDCVEVQAEYKCNDRLEDLILNRQYQMSQNQINQKLSDLCGNNSDSDQDPNNMLNQLLQQLNQQKAKAMKSKPKQSQKNLVFKQKREELDDIQLMLASLDDDPKDIYQNKKIAQKQDQIQSLKQNENEIQMQRQGQRSRQKLRQKSRQRQGQRQRLRQKDLYKKRQNQQQIQIQEKRKRKQQKQSQKQKQQIRQKQKQIHIEKQKQTTLSEKRIEKVTSEDKHINEKPIGITQVIHEQNIDGSWDNIKLLEVIFRQKDSKQQVFQNIKIQLQTRNQAVVCTYLMLKWIQKYHNKKEYCLLIKKALEWLQKMTRIEDLVDLDKFII